MSATENDIAASQPLTDLPNSAAQQQYESDLKYIGERIKKRECILFLGSAIHAPAPSDSQYDYTAEKCPPIGEQLSERLAKLCNYPPTEKDRGLQRVAWYYEHANFRYRLVDEVKAAVHTGKEPSPVLRALVQLGFPIVITTNYDQLYERSLDLVAQLAARAEGKSEEEVNDTKGKYDLSIYSNESSVKTKDCSREPSSAQPYILKIHGDIDHRESIVITDEDYIQFVLRMSDKSPFHPVGKSVLKHLVTWPTLFIGYRLSDYNLRLLFKTLRWKVDPGQIPPTYSVDLQPDVLIRDVWENQRRYVRFIERNLWNFVPDLYKEVTGQEMPR